MSLVIGLVVASLAHLLLSCVRHAVLMLGPVGLHRVMEGHRGLEGYFQAGYLRSPSGVRASLLLASQGALVTATVMGVLVDAARGGARPWLFGAAWGLLVAWVGGGVIARGLAALRPEGCLVRLLWLVRLVDGLLWPLSRAVVAMGRSLGVRFREPEGSADPEDQDEEIEAFIDVGEQEGLLEEGEGSLIRGVLDFGDRVVREVMTPRTAVVAVEDAATVEQLRELVVREKHSRLPVYRGSLDEIVGVVFVRDLMEVLGSVSPETSIRQLVRPAFFVPETKRISVLLRELQRRRTHLAIIVDEYGGTAGLVTIEDLVEEIVGEIQDEHEPLEEAIRVGDDGALEVTGDADIERVAEALDMDLEDEEYETVAGFVFSTLGRVPRRGESFVRDGVAVEVLDADRRRVHRVRMRRQPAGHEAPEADAGGAS
ncbi:MAG: hemolysin family protein [Acidobacteriota bacterium]|jgi:CBS domain containing-hemolysin-like protein